ncbi:tetratricopeptide repeat protein [Desulfonema ishimotonii]|uniref:tetratricopeptide repeat protein n=1 Tax=Desulfonema ishimotonii TaxID=45657 RepID=UPI000F58D600
MITFNIELVLLYYQQGHYGEAEPLIQKALVLRKKVLGLKHPDTLTSLSSLAGIYILAARWLK